MKIKHNNRIINFDNVCKMEIFGDYIEFMNLNNTLTCLEFESIEKCEKAFLDIENALKKNAGFLDLTI